MLGHKLVLIGVLGVWLCGGFVQGTVSAAEPAVIVHQAAGEIVWLDIPLGKLQLKGDVSSGTRATAEYRITQHETRVTNASDTQFLTITDLRAGQHISIQSRGNEKEQLATKITVKLNSEPLFQQAEGTIESIDGTAGTFTLKETTTTGAVAQVSSFTFDPKDIVVMESPSLQPVRLEVNRSEERRVGKECTSWCRSRWSPYH